MNKKSILHIISFIILIGQLHAQTIDDAARYSFLQYNSTARFAGVSGAFSALGADVSVATVNPAGIAEFRKSEVTGTINYFNTQNEASLDGTTTSMSRSSVGLGNLAAVFHYNPPAFNTRTVNLAIGYNQLANYNETIEYAGTGPGTIVERFLERAESLSPDDLDVFQGGPAFDAGAIYELDGDTSYESDFVTLQEVVDRGEVIERSGSLNEIFIAVGSNIKNKISWGVTVGFPFVNLKERKSYTEEDGADQIDIFNSLGYTQDLDISGVGFNMKAGFIYKLTPRFRIGGAIHTPSYFFMEDEFATQVSYSFTANGTTENFSAGSPDNMEPFKYRFQNPWRALIGAGYLFKSGDIRGFVSGELEYVDYTSGSFNLTADSSDPLDQFFEDDLNEEISTLFNSGFNIRVGTELAYKMIRGRLGVMLPTSPYNNTATLDFDPSISTGLGYRGNRMYIDAAITLRSSDSSYRPYPLLDENREPRVGITSTRSVITFTIGSKI